MELKDWLTAAGILIASCALLVNAYSVERTRRTTRAQFWLSLRDQFMTHSEVHQKLRDGEWSAPGSGPASSAEWAKLDAYMGLFEHCEVLLREGLIDLHTFSEIYRYRVKNILKSPTIVVKKLIDEKDEWMKFIGLVDRLGLSKEKAESASKFKPTELA